MWFGGTSLPPDHFRPPRPSIGIAAAIFFYKKSPHSEAVLKIDEPFVLVALIYAIAHAFILNIVTAGYGYNCGSNPEETHQADKGSHANCKPRSLRNQFPRDQQAAEKQEDKAKTARDPRCPI